MKFLTELARHITENQQDIPLQNTVVILPNKRAKRLLLKELSLQINKPFFSPHLFDINDFIESLSPLKKTDNMQLYLMLYHLYRQNEEMKSHDFHTFLSWGKVFLQDINDIDLQMVDAALVFQNLTDIKELEIYFGKETLTANQEYYVRFYRQLGDLYVRFVQQLEAKQCAYQGGIYKDVALHIEEYAGKNPYQRYIFAGLSVLSPAEFKIVNHFVTQFQAELYFDFDTFYAQSQHDIIDNLKEFLHIKEFKTIYDYYAKIPKIITEVSVSKQITQVQYAVERIKEIETKEGNLDNTALVLADESLLLPFLHAYDCSEANLTMGYPLTETPAAHLLNTFLLLIQNANRFKELDKKQIQLFYHQDILLLLQNPLIKNCFETPEEYADFIQRFLRKGKTFFLYQEIPEIPHCQLPDLSLEGILLLKELCRYFTLLQVQFTGNSFFANSIALIISILEQMTKMMDNAGFTVDFKTLDLLIKEQTGSISIPLQGNYDKGLQVMGVLETRALDFKNVIILSLNEGILPMGKKQNSLILFDLKKHFKLPTYHHKDTVFAYHFFRLLQRAENIYLIYNANSDKTLAEKSRFISQLEFEVKSQRLEDTIVMQKEVIAIPPVIEPQKRDITIQKNADILERLRTYSYSPTSLSRYIRCPLQFYLSSVARIKPKKEILEDVEQKAIGLVLHKILEDLLHEIIEFPAQKETIIKTKLENLDKFLSKEFTANEDTMGMNQTEGKLYLAIELAKRNLQKYLKAFDKELMQSGFTVMQAEAILTGSRNVKNVEVSLTGTADRIDVSTNTVRILDYKTGRVNSDELKLPEMEKLFTEPKWSKLFQLLMYACLLKQDENFARYANYQVTAGIVSFQTLHQNAENHIIKPVIKYEQTNCEYFTEALLTEFEEHLETLLEEILDEQHPFSQTNHGENCVYCDYQEFCGRISDD
jgi:CRISPR/Cas system-associated exonuclease Cas4 (RecB family)